MLDKTRELTLGWSVLTKEQEKGERQKSGLRHSRVPANEAITCSLGTHCEYPGAGASQWQPIAHWPLMGKMFLPESTPADNSVACDS